LKRKTTATTRRKASEALINGRPSILPRGERKAAETPNLLKLILEKQNKNNNKAASEASNQLKILPGA
jgi:hypothetical protein